MDILTDKSYKSYNYTSRYSSYPYYYNYLDDKYVYGLTSQLSTNTDYTTHDVEIGDTLDKLAYKYYGRPDLYWVIADFNRIQDPFIVLYNKYNYINIPNITNIRRVNFK